MDAWQDAKMDTDYFVVPFSMFLGNGGEQKYNDIKSTWESFLIRNGGRAAGVD